ncbi:hypothetical protein D3C77_74580 [compost metagenome]|uniref:Uncharacterized protein n=1 Tax=Pseudomonas fluorescens TaxID=294 RepID=A0A5E6XDF7_PSEFL|nr:hypothetical protein PS652_05281 [Pseudomonas fluorescens]
MKIELTQSITGQNKIELRIKHLDKTRTLGLPKAAVQALAAVRAMPKAPHGT